jgi:hypothetical protein
MNYPHIPQQEPPNTELWAMLIMFVIVFALCFLVFFIGKAHAQEVDIPKLADSIYLAEGGAKTSHPYGILAKYNHTTPRQACINTINHALRDFKGGDFIVFLGSRYCPPNAHPLNQNWIKNVRYFYERNKSKD